MTDTELLREALKALEGLDNISPDWKAARKAIAKLEERLLQE